MQRKLTDAETRKRNESSSSQARHCLNRYLGWTGSEVGAGQEAIFGLIPRSSNARNDSSISLKARLCVKVQTSPRFSMVHCAEQILNQEFMSNANSQIPFALLCSDLLATLVSKFLAVATADPRGSTKA